ncbi:ABC transporter permease [Aureimonas frigidaquae]|uniref:Binding-protein-dependent transport system inner membrane component n=1 Tax=Aureimonas frigidaquae TaxID=424757 RepID=A0A0P0Z3Q7_9HYPH|nr:ABC transporter permease subunit [Aureimonas frigidaquae]BAT28748.1 binding-protein-dependent transport system inner membrane component [Aureimonas frigidaquae]
MSTLAPAAASARPSMRGAAWAAFILVALAAWQWSAHRFHQGLIVAGPLDIAGYLVANAASLGRATMATLTAAGWGFLFGNGAAVALAVLCQLVPALRSVLTGLALAIFCLPLVATGPILRILFGPGLGPQVTLAALAVTFPTFLCVCVGLRAAPTSWFDLTRLYGRGAVAELVYVRAGAALPYLFAGLQIAAPAAILGAMVGEFTGAEQGLGLRAIRAMGAIDTAAIWSVATIAAILSILAYGAVSLLARRLGTPPPLMIGRGQTGRLARRFWGLSSAVTVLIILVLWQASFAAFGLSTYAAKRPLDVWAFLLTVPDAAANRATLGAALMATLKVAVPGYLGGLSLGAGLAAFVVLWPRLTGVVMGPAIAARSIPIVSTAPLIVLMLGRGGASTTAIVAIMVFFPALVASLRGMRQLPGQAGDLMRIYAARRWDALILGRLPAMLPAFFAAARMLVPAAILAATTAEWLATGRGMGGLIATTASTSGYAMLWSATVVLTATSGILYALVGQAEAIVLRRYAPEQLTA